MNALSYVDILCCLPPTEACTLRDSGVRLIMTQWCCGAFVFFLPHQAVCFDFLGILIPVLSCNHLLVHWEGLLCSLPPLGPKKTVLILFFYCGEVKFRSAWLGWALTGQCTKFETSYNFVETVTSLNFPSECSGIRHFIYHFSCSLKKQLDLIQFVNYFSSAKWDTLNFLTRKLC